MSLLRTAVISLLVMAGGCNDASRMAMGDVHGVIVVASDSLWAEVEDTVLQTLQPSIFAVRDEATFRLTHTTADSPHWGDLRRFRQILAIGHPDDRWVSDALRRGGAAVDDPPAIVELDNVWARNQRVTVAALPRDGAAAAMEAMVDSLAALYDHRYRHWARSRMFASGHDTELGDTLRQQAGFVVDMPNVYRWRRTADSAYLFINDQPDASELVRSLLVTWRAGTGDEPTVERALAWRDQAARQFYDWGMTTERERLQTRPVPAPGDGGLEVRGIWEGTLDDYPQAGPFIARLIDCPQQNRRYLLDAWLYAPARAKYQYMIQLETLLESFRCGDGG